MPHYFFHLHNDMDVPDDEGRELPDLSAAREYARRSAVMLIGEMVKEEARIVLHHRIDIEDRHGQVLDSVRFRDAVRIED